MKTIFIGVGNSGLSTLDLLDLRRDEDFNRVITEYQILESHVVYFSAGESKIKEILIKKDPTFSA